MNINKYIEYSILSPSAIKEDIINGVKIAIEYEFRGIVIAPIWIHTVGEIIAESDYKPHLITICDFPHGNSLTSTRVAAVKDLINNGADEVDVVMQIGLFKFCNWFETFKDFQSIKGAAKDTTVKIIIETGPQFIKIV